jgi:methylated-DNA-[protein]-cysteine S-methyltransferase
MDGVAGEYGNPFFQIKWWEQIDRYIMVRGWICESVEGGGWSQTTLQRIELLHDSDAVKRAAFDYSSGRFDICEGVLSFYEGKVAPDFKIDVSMLTSFQRSVFQSVFEIPKGRSHTYGEIADMIGCPSGARAVGLALSSNPFPLLIPCHRVVSSKGLGGYRFGSDLKRRLLTMEKVFHPSEISGSLS